MNTKEVAKREPTLLEIIGNAVQKENINIETIERLVALKERMDALEAQRAFNEDFAKFQAECPVIPKRTDGAKTRGGAVAFKYAALEDIHEFIREPLTKHGFSYSFNSEIKDDRRVVTCTVTHRQGHSQQSVFESPVDDNKGGMMNNIQRESSTRTYGMRNALKLALGLIEAGEDDDGRGATEVQLTTEQIKNLEKGIESDQSLKDKMLRAYNISDIKFLPSEKYEECLKRINAYLDNKANKETENAKN